MTSVQFYFDYLSPFSYFAWREISLLQTPIEFVPVPMGTLFNHWGIKGPGEVVPKRDFLLKQCLRFAARGNIPFTTPKVHPFNSLYALRLSLKEVAGELQGQVVEVLWKTGWEKGLDLGNPDVIMAELNEQGLPADRLYEKSFTPEARSALKENVARALSHGVFGVPSFVAQDELFWGLDALKDLQAFIQGKDPLDRAKFEKILRGNHV